MNALIAVMFAAIVAEGVTIAVIGKKLIATDNNVEALDQMHNELFRKVCAIEEAEAEHDYSINCLEELYRMNDKALEEHKRWDYNNSIRVKKLMNSPLYGKEEDDSELQS